MTTLIQLTKSKLRTRILTYFFTNPQSSHYLREIAAILNQDVGNLSREFNRLEKEGIFVSQVRGRQKYFSLNKNYPLYKELKSIVFKTAGVEGALKKVVLSIEGVEAAFLYGSFAKKKETAISDIDLFIVGSLDEHKLLTEIEKLEKQLGREINYTIYPAKEFAKKRERDSFIIKILKGPKIVLKGKL